MTYSCGHNVGATCMLLILKLGCSSKLIREILCNLQLDTQFNQCVGMTMYPKNKLSKLSRLFRSKSDQPLKDSPVSSTSASPKNSAGGAPRRRLLRVIRDNESAGEEWENPHVVRRYTKQYWEEQMEEARRLQHSVSMPYEVPNDQSILKKTTSTESENETGGGGGNVTSGTEGASSPSIFKRASFKEEVLVIEFNYTDRIAKHAHFMHATKLGPSDEDEEFALSDSAEELSFTTTARLERQKEFMLAKQLSFEEDDERDEGLVESEKSVSFSDSFQSHDQESAGEVNSDSGALSDESGCCSDTEKPKKKLKKRRLHLRLTAKDNGNDSDKENESHPESAPSTKVPKHKFYSKTIQKLLYRVHFEHDRETNSSGCEETLGKIDKRL